MATPALAEYGSDHLKREFLRGTVEGDLVACLGVSEDCAGSDVAGKFSFSQIIEISPNESKNLE